MSELAIEVVREYFEKLGIADRIQELDASSATVEQAAEALNVEPARIAKTVSFKKDEGCILIVAAGDTKIDNPKFKATFGVKAKMLTPEEVLERVGHAVGGVCPFAISTDVLVFLDVSLQRFDTVFPACGSSNSAVEMTCDELYTYSLGRQWVDVCKGWD